MNRIFVGEATGFPAPRQFEKSHNQTMELRVASQEKGGCIRPIVLDAQVHSASATDVCSLWTGGPL